QARDAYLARTVDQMQAFADGKGNVPAIVKQSGKSSAAGIRYGRMEMSFFLGVAYLEGTCVQRDAARAAHWLQRAIAMGSRPAQARLGAARSNVAG
ncbi:MAG TPA: SEL1-like repeat protein, partial [Ramlibacter sp.]|nr:SEL1-like repeat protein [Ramlibacter sp.]